MGHLLYATAAAWSPSKITRNHCLENGIPWEDTVLVHDPGPFLQEREHSAIKSPRIEMRA
jgi:hypothetical protein